MNRFPAVLLSLSIVGIITPIRAQIISQNVVGPTYLASLYGVVCDDMHDDTTALSNLASQISNLGVAGGTIVLPSTGNWCKISLAAINWPANVNLQGCGMYGSNQSLTPPIPPCGLDLRYMDSTAKIRFTQYGQVIFRDLAVVDKNSGTSECPSTPGYPFFFISKTTVHFQNVSIQGSGAGGRSACNDGFILGSSSSTCQTDGTCFYGYGSTFQNLFFAYVRRFALFNSAVNGTDWDYIFGAYHNGNSNDGVHPTGSAIEINCIANNSCYGNVFKNIQLEQADYGSPALSNYLYGLDVMTNAGSNFIFAITCSDFGLDAVACVHIASTSIENGEIGPQVVVGCIPYYSNVNFFSCVKRDSLASYRDLVIDQTISSIFGQTYYGANLGTSSKPFNYLRLGVGIDSPTNITGIPNADALGGIVGFSGTGAGTFNPIFEYQLFSDGVTGTSQFTVLPFETWLGQFTLTTGTTNGTQPIQMQPIYSYGAATQTSPTVFSIPAGAGTGSYVTNAPPLYVSGENQVSFQGVNSLPASGTAFATVRGFTASVVGSASGVPQTVLGTYYNGSVGTGASATYYTSFSQQMGWTNTIHESRAYVVVPFNYLAKGLCVVTSSAQSGTGSLTITLRQNGVSASPQATVPASGGVGTWCDNTGGSLSGTLGDQLDLQLTNTASVASATIVSITLGLTPLLTSPATVQPTGMIVFGLGDRNLVTNTYFAPFGGGNDTSTAANAQVALPRSVTIRNLHCWVTACPSSNTTLTVWKNGAPGSSPLHAFIQGIGTCGAPGDFSDLSDSDKLSFFPGDTIELAVVTGLGPPPVSSCTVEHD